MGKFFGKRSKRVSQEQKEVLIKFVQDHPELIRKRLLMENGMPFDTKTLWAELIIQLESCRTGSKGKSLEEWKKTWSDLKHNAFVAVRTARREWKINRSNDISDEALPSFAKQLVALIEKAREKDRKYQKCRTDYLNKKDHKHVKINSDDRNIEEEDISSANNNSDTDYGNISETSDTDEDVNRQSCTTEFSSDHNDKSEANYSLNECNTGPNTIEEPQLNNPKQRNSLTKNQKCLLIIKRQRNKIEMEKLKLLRRDIEIKSKISNSLEKIVSLLNDHLINSIF